MDTTTPTLIEQAHAALEAARRVDHLEMQSPPIVFRHAAKVLREWDGKRVALLDYIVAVRAAIAEDHNAALVENVERCMTCGGYGVIECPPCRGEGCRECSGTTEVYCADCGGYDLLPYDLANAAIKRVDARPENAAILLDLELSQAARRVLALTSVPPHEPGDIDAFAERKRKQYA